MRSANQTPIEARDMGIVHRTLRTTFDESARLVRAETDPTPQRLAFLANHIALTLDLLHLHHDGEDEKLWPVLTERAPAEAEMVREVADQHAGVDSTIQQVRDLLSAHLDDEERLVVPLAAVTVTQDEWNAIGEHARASIPQEQIFLVFGMLLEPLDEDEDERSCWPRFRRQSKSCGPPWANQVGSSTRRNCGPPEVLAAN